MAPPPVLTLKVLLVDADGARAAGLARVLGTAGFHHVRHVPGGVSLADDVAAFTPDVMIVDMALPDRDTLEGLRQSSGRAPRPAVLFADDPALAAEAIAAGVHAYHFDETGAQEIKPILIAAIALFRHRPKSADPE
ncbi:MAG: response regulator [Rhizomicrobium sp.]